MIHKSICTLSCSQVLQNSSLLKSNGNSKPFAAYSFPTISASVAVYYHHPVQHTSSIFNLSFQVSTFYAFCCC